MQLSSRRKVFLIVSGLLLLFFTLSLCWFLFIPPSQTSMTKIITVKKGMNLRKISLILKQEGIIRNELFFAGMATVLGEKTKIKAGEYEFHTRMGPLEVLNHLVKGQVKRHLVTIVEGYTLSQIAQLLENLNIMGKEAFLRKATSPVFISSLGLSHLAESSLEGYLFPDTYHLIKETEPEAVIQMMVNRFKKICGADLADRASALGISGKEAVVLASIIEKETSIPEEKPLISAVFHNRLRKKIPLQSDPTVIYGIKNFNGNLTKEHLLKPTSYNTYLIQGLPPTPICNPGKDSLLAALSPASVSYLYFVSKNDGSHFFSSTIEEHNQAVWKYQKTLKNHRKNNLTNK